jgi:hypothetical protein
MDEKSRIELEAAAFRGLVEHLRRRTDVQNIDLMNLAGFCRNCLSKWYLAAARERGVELDYDQACEAVYGMPYGEWKTRRSSWRASRRPSPSTPSSAGIKRRAEAAAPGPGVRPGAPAARASPRVRARR